MLKGLQTRLVLILVLLTVSIMSVIGVVLVNSVTTFYKEDFASQLSVFFNDDMKASLSQSAREGEGGEALYSRLALYSARLGIDTYRNFYILSDKGEYLFGSNPDLGQILEITPNIISAIGGKTGSESAAFASYMDYAVPIPAGGEKTLIVYIKDTKQEVRDLSWVMIVIIIQTLFLTLAIALVLSFFLARTIVKPIQNITYGAIKIAAGDFTHKISVESEDEIGTLTETFNDMAGVLKTTLEDIEGERSKLSTIFLYMTDGVAAFDEKGRLLHINNAAKSMLAGGLDEKQADFDSMLARFLGMRFEKVRAEAENSTLMLDLFVEGRTYKCDFALFATGEGENGIIVVMHDVTEQEKIDRARREFIANVSHELRTPLTNVKSYTETVIENADLPEEDRGKFLSVVVGETDRMIRIVKDLLLLSRLDSKKMELDFLPFDIRDALKNVYEAMRMEARKRGQTLVYNAPESLPEVRGDKERVEQVMVNVISNAIKYTPDGGRITISCGESEGRIKVNVEDTGIGIPKEDLEHIFERFYRVDKARSREMGGTGLGLAIAKEIVEEHGGKIYMQSAPGLGTTVTILLPAAEAQGG